MKTTIIISMLCLSAIGMHAQDLNDEAARRQELHQKALEIYCRTNGNMGANAHMQYKTNYSNVHAAYPDAPANAVPAYPSRPYVALQDPPCYKYTNSNGQVITQCPGARYSPANCANPQSAMTVIQENGNMNVSAEKSFSGNYPNLHSVYPQAPANAKPAYPTSPYTQLQDPPCYKYINKRGLEVTECPGAQFEPEHR